MSTEAKETRSALALIDAARGHYNAEHHRYANPSPSAPRASSPCSQSAGRLLSRFPHKASDAEPLSPFLSLLHGQDTRARCVLYGRCATRCEDREGARMSTWGPPIGSETANDPAPCVRPRASEGLIEGERLIRLRQHGGGVGFTIQ